MTNKTAALRYARALFEVAVKEQIDLERVERDLAAFASLLSDHPELSKVMLNPVVPVTRKRPAVVELARQMDLVPTVAKLAALLAERDRLALLHDILAAYRDRLLAYRHIVRAEVTTAEPLPDGRANAITERLTQLTGQAVALRTRTDPGIVGGVVARIGSTVYDGSIARQLAKMRERLTSGS